MISEKCRLLKAYRCSRIRADRWAFGLAADAYRADGVRCEPSPKVKSDLYLDFLAILNSGQIRLLDHEQQLSELLNLERRQHWGGRSSIDHPVGNFHDDAINATAGAAVTAVSRGSSGIIKVSAAALEWASRPGPPGTMAPRIW